MSLFHLISSGPWWAWLAKIAIVLGIFFSTKNFTQELVAFYRQGHAAEVAVAVAFGLLVPSCLNGIYEGFDRGNWLGFAFGLVGIWFLTKGTLALFAPQYLTFMPF
jgi:hypothetical protein